MSSPEQGEQRSSVKITRNAKGEPQFEIKVYVGDDSAALAAARALAIDNYRLLSEHLK